MTTQIKIYGSQGCQTCTKLKKDFENQTSNLEEEDIEADIPQRKFLKILLEEGKYESKHDKFHKKAYISFFDRWNDFHAEQLRQAAFKAAKELGWVSENYDSRGEYEFA